METYEKNNESTDSFFTEHYTASVQSLREGNPNLQRIDEDALLRAESIRKTKKQLVGPPTATRQSSRYSLAPSPLITPSVTQETSDIDKLTRNLQGQNFWKYHAMSIGKNQMYLTTNPDIKHLYCRTGPGYFVELILPKVHHGVRQSHKQSDIGFRLIFKRQVYDEVDNEDKLREPTECIVVTKDSKEEGGSFHMVASLINDLNGFTRETPRVMKNTAVETPIEELIELQNRDPNNADLQKLIPTFHRFVVKWDDHNWLVGSNPVAKQKTSNKLKINNDMFKLTGKQNVYFYGKGDAVKVKALEKASKRASFMKSLRSEVRSVQYDDKILALFRSHEKRFKKKVLKTLNSTNQGSPTSPYTEDYNYIENNQYYTPGDGLNQLNPKDDAPNGNKIGWLTIWEDETTVDFWELVLGYTFAVGFDRVIDEYVQE